MINLFVLRPVHMLDVSFQLMRHKFFKCITIAMAVSVPLQAIVWIIQVAMGAMSDADLESRTLIIAMSFQLFSIGVAMTVTSALLSSTVGRIYSQTQLQGMYSAPGSIAKIPITLLQIALQIGFLACALLTRYVLGFIMQGSDADSNSFFAILVFGAIWTFLTLFFAYSIPVATHEGVPFSNVFKRNSKLNKSGYFGLVGAYLLCVLILILVITPAVSLIQLFVANNVIQSDLGSLALTNLIIAFIMAFVAVAYSHLLCVSYFNTRIKSEAFDVAVALHQIQDQERTARGELLSTVTK